MDTSDNTVQEGLGAFNQQSDDPSEEHSDVDVDTSIGDTPDGGEDIDIDTDSDPPEQQAIDIDGLPAQELASRALKCARRLLSAERVVLASHIDADGLTSAGVASLMLDRAEVDYDTVFYKQLDEDAIDELAEKPHDTVLFTDFGSGQINSIARHVEAGDFIPVIADHHQPVDFDDETSDEVIQTVQQCHLNPLRVGINGANELSGAGAVYVLARYMNAILDAEHPSIDVSSFDENRDLSKLALIGAVGDMQAGPDGLVGTNAEIVDEAVDVGVAIAKPDIALYGRQTRPVTKLLEYSTDVQIPHISGSEDGSVAFLSDLDLDLRTDNGKWKHWCDLHDDEKQTVVSNLIQTAIQRGVPSYRVDRLTTTIYELVDEPERTPLRDVSEFSTLLNATARYEREDVGLAVVRGDRSEKYAEAERLLTNHRKNISQGIEWVVEEGTNKETAIQWVDCGDTIRETIVGIIAGMAMGEGNIRRNVPILAFATVDKTDVDSDGDTPEDGTDDAEGGDTLDEDDEVVDELKVSARATQRLVEDGVDLSEAMEVASEAVGGGGGGHDIAAGATIPAHKRDEFIANVDEIIDNQMS